MINTIFATGSAVGTTTLCGLGVQDCQVPIGIAVGGTFVGTVLVEISFDSDAAAPTWIAFGSAITTPSTVKLDIPVKSVRLRCSAFTSGTIVGGIGALLGTV